MSLDQYSSSPARVGGLDIGLRDHMQRIYNRMAVGVLITGLVAFFVGNNPELLKLIFSGPQKWLVMLAPLGIVMFGFNPSRMSSSALRLSFGALSVVYGLSFAAIFAMFTGESIAKAFFVSAGMFAGISIFGYTTKKDLSGMGSFAMMGIIGVLILSLVNIFMASTFMSNVIAGVGIIAFAGMTAWETQRMKEMYSPRDDAEMASRMSWVAALNLYISFIAMFQYVMHFMGQRE
jgi:FtsH-binding integral membrane protein